MVVDHVVDDLLPTFQSRSCRDGNLCGGTAVAVLDITVRLTTGQ
jgi:hypothetical protein